MSLFETRWMMGVAAEKGRFGLTVLADLIVTGTIAVSVYVPILMAGTNQNVDTPYNLDTVFMVGFLLRVTDVERQPFRSIEPVPVSWTRGWPS